uniref:ShKT domain-containing protein n=1 Tax=Rhabditophanes sp. KR3021 TaxID=114890 RepID=A0AC35U4N4_9BILA
MIEKAIILKSNYQNRLSYELFYLIGLLLLPTRGINEKEVKIKTDAITSLNNEYGNDSGSIKLTSPGKNELTSGNVDKIELSAPIIPNNAHEIANEESSGEGQNGSEAIIEKADYSKLSVTTPQTTHNSDDFYNSNIKVELIDKNKKINTNGTKLEETINSVVKLIANNFENKSIAEMNPEVSATIPSTPDDSDYVLPVKIHPCSSSSDGLENSNKSIPNNPINNIETSTSEMDAITNTKSSDSGRSTNGAIMTDLPISQTNQPENVTDVTNTIQDNDMNGTTTQRTTAGILMSTTLNAISSDSYGSNGVNTPSPEKPKIISLEENVGITPQPKSNIIEEKTTTLNVDETQNRTDLSEQFTTLDTSDISSATTEILTTTTDAIPLIITTPGEKNVDDHIKSAPVKSNEQAFTPPNSDYAFNADNIILSSIAQKIQSTTESIVETTQPVFNIKNVKIIESSTIIIPSSFGTTIESTVFPITENTTPESSDSTTWVQESLVSNNETTHHETTTHEVIPDSIVDNYGNVKVEEVSNVQTTDNLTPVVLTTLPVSEIQVTLQPIISDSFSTPLSKTNSSSSIITSTEISFINSTPSPKDDVILAPSVGKSIVLSCGENISSNSNDNLDITKDNIGETNNLITTTATPSLESTSSHQIIQSGYDFPVANKKEMDEGGNKEAGTIKTLPKLSFISSGDIVFPSISLPATIITKDDLNNSELLPTTTLSVSTQKAKRIRHTFEKNLNLTKATFNPQLTPSFVKKSTTISSSPVKNSTISKENMSYYLVSGSTARKWKPFVMDCNREVDEKDPVLCKEWGRAGLCLTHKPTMFLFCRKTCLCNGPEESKSDEDYS